jgi:hypothetical protein
MHYRLFELLFMKDWKNLRNKLRLFVPMLIYSLALILIPTNIIGRGDLRLLAMIIFQKRTVIVLKKRLHVLLVQFKTRRGKCKKNRWIEAAEAQHSFPNFFNSKILFSHPKNL